MEGKTNKKKKHWLPWQPFLIRLIFWAIFHRAIWSMRAPSLNQPVLPLCVQQVCCCRRSSTTPPKGVWAAMLNCIYGCNSVTNPSSILFCLLFVCLLCIVARKINGTNKTNKQTYTLSPSAPLQKSNALKYASSTTIHVHRRRPSPVWPARHLQAAVPPAEKWSLT